MFRKLFQGTEHESRFLTSEHRTQDSPKNPEPRASCCGAPQIGRTLETCRDLFSRVTRRQPCLVGRLYGSGGGWGGGIFVPVLGLLERVRRTPSSFSRGQDDPPRDHRGGRRRSRLPSDRNPSPMQSFPNRLHTSWLIRRWWGSLGSCRRAPRPWMLWSALRSFRGMMAGFVWNLLEPLPHGGSVPFLERRHRRGTSPRLVAPDPTVRGMLRCPG